MKTLRSKVFLVALFTFASITVMSQTEFEDPKYGVDAETRKECLSKISMYQEF